MYVVRLDMYVMGYFMYVIGNSMYMIRLARDMNVCCTNTHARGVPSGHTTASTTGVTSSGTRGLASRHASGGTSSRTSPIASDRASPTASTLGTGMARGRKRSQGGSRTCSLDQEGVNAILFHFHFPAPCQVRAQLPVEK